MSLREAPEIFVVGEQVILRNDRKDREVEVIAVMDDEVVVVSDKGEQMIFKSRSSDWRHVAVDEEDSQGPPTFILHRKPVKGRSFRPKRKVESQLLPPPTGGRQGLDRYGYGYGSGSGSVKNFFGILFDFLFTWMR